MYYVLYIYQNIKSFHKKPHLCIRLRELQNQVELNLEINL